MQFVQPLKSEFTCKVCKEAWDPEAVTKCKDCEATFCKACYDEAMMKEAKCHSCLKQPATFNNVHMLVRSMATNLNVFCRYKAHGCDWKGNRTAYPGHVDSCPLKPKEFTYVDESAIPVELMCPICNVPFTDPVQLPCEHVFCNACISEAMKGVASPVCPVDRSSVTHESLTQPPKFISEILDEIPVYCAHRHASVGSCAWTGRRRDYIGHRASCKGGVAPTPKPDEKKVVVVVPEPEDKKDPAAPTAGATKSDKMVITTMSEFPFIDAQDTKQDIYALAHLQAPHLENLDQRKKPLSISAVIDVSGSMAGGKLKMAQESLQFMIDELTDRDELGIIAFHTDVEQTVSLGKMNANGKKLARAAVQGLNAKACTNLSGGLFAGMNQLERKAFMPQDFNAYNADGSPKSGANRGFGPGPNHLDALFGFAPVTPDLGETLASAAVSVTHYGSSMTRDGAKHYQYGCEITADHAAVSCISKITMQGDTNVLSAKVLNLAASGHHVSPFGFGGCGGPNPRDHHHHHLKSSSRVSVPQPNQAGVPHKFTWESDRPEISLTLTVEYQPHLGQAATHHTLDLSGFGTMKLPMPGAKPKPVQPKPTPAQSADSCRAVLLFTDGAANGGITKEDALKRVMQQRLESCPDMLVHTFGFGTDHNASLLQGLAEIASGSYYYIQDVATMKEGFADCLGGLMSTVAQNIQLTVKPQPGFKVDKVLSSYEVKSAEDGTAVVTMRDLYSAEQRDVLVRLKMTSSQTVGSTSSLVAFEVKYDSLLSGSTESVQGSASVKMEKEKCTETPNTHIDEQRARIEVTEALKAARLEADSGNVAGAKARMQAQRSVMTSAHVPSPYFNAMMNDMEQVEAQMGSTAIWASSGSKDCAQVSNCHGAQRMNRGHCAPAAQVAAFGAYDNSYKKDMRAKSHKS